jgi:hypothetical protein
MRRKILTNVKTMLTFAQGRGLVAQNVALGVKLKKGDREETSGPCGPVSISHRWPNSGC